MSDNASLRGLKCCENVGINFPVESGAELCVLASCAVVLLCGLRM